MDRVISRDQATLEGLSKYFTGCPCKRGHVTLRRVCDRSCVACVYEKTALWAKNNRKKATAKQRGYLIRVSSNPEYKIKRQVWNRNYRLRVRGTEGHHTAQDITSLFSDQKGLCYCGKDLSLGYHVDHKTPLSREGSNWPENLQLLCPFCNDSKGAKTMDEWLCREVAA